MTGPRGAALATTVLVGAVLLVVALTMAGVGSFHLRLATRQANLEQARNAAESVTALAIDRLSHDQHFGLAGDADQRSLEVVVANTTGRLTFEPDRADLWGVEVSHNNLEQDTAAPASGRSLAPFSAQLKAVGESNGVTYALETILRIPHYRYAIATSGTLTSSGGLFVASVPDLQTLAGGLAAVPPDQLLPGHLVANAVGPLWLASSPLSPTNITGDAQSGGSISLGAQTSVGGAVLENADPENLPELDVADYDPAGWTGLYELTTSVSSSPLTLEGPVRRSGDLTISNGGLELDGAYLYVDGNLVVNGGVSGKGAIFCTGDVTLNGGSALSTDNVQALVAAGNVTISGDDQQSSHFNGVVYGGGNIAISDITLVGSLVNNAATPTTTSISDTNVVEVPEVLSLEWDFPFATAQPIFPGAPADAFGIFTPTDVDLSLFYDSEADVIDPELASDDNIPVIFRIKVKPIYLDAYPSGYFETTDLDKAIEAVNANLAIPGEVSSEELMGHLTQVALPAYRQKFRDNLANLNDLYQKTKDQHLQKGKFSLDPNQFLQFSEKARVVWVVH
ncbi:MAG: hypothetical protein AB7S38_20135 [Vulcanimicrobiota bacterium]